MSMYRQMYSLAFILATPLLLGRLIWRARSAPAYAQRIPERFALTGPLSRSIKEMSRCRPIWVHAVSVGEVLASAPMIDGLLERYGPSGCPIVVTTTTPTGSDQVVSRWGDKVIHCYAPYDCGWTMRLFIKRLDPQLLIIMETELWPNMIHYAHKAHCKIILANARLSEKSARGYQRFNVLTRTMLTQLTKVAVQAEADGARFIELGLPSAALERTGSVKFDIAIDQKVLQAGRLSLRSMNRPVWIAASTHPGEDELILEAFKCLHERITYDQQASPLLILVPRHPERFEAVAALSKEAGWQVARRSDVKQPDASVDVYVGDTMGELVALYAMSHVAFVGGSLIERGGHNVLEPIAAHIPVVVGPHMFNFQFIYDQLKAVEGIETVQTQEALAEAVGELLTDRCRYDAQVKSASAFLADNVGALKRLNTMIDDVVKREVKREVKSVSQHVR